MTNETLMPQYMEGERTCPICGAPLPAHRTWPGARYRTCSGPKCVAIAKGLKQGRYVGPRERKCEVDGCSNFVPEGRYGMHPDFLSCSATCWHRRESRGKIEMVCGCGCGTKFLRKSRRKRIHGLVFFSPAHQGRYITTQYLTKSCYGFRTIVDEYLAGFAATRYRDLSTARSAMARLFLFLGQEGIASLEDVTPTTITRFLTWSKRAGRTTSSNQISCISVFFNWLIVEGRRTSANPVVRSIHRQQKKHPSPRPFEAEELDFAWQLLDERGTARLRFAMAAGEEAGLRSGEICRLRMQDVDLTRQQFFVRLPNKTNRERFAFFGEKTKRYYREWMAERDANCRHDLVLHNTLGHPLNTSVLATEFRRILCKVDSRGKSVNEVGFDRWSTHRLRHTMASNLVSSGADVATVMAAGGWRSYAGMCGYARVDPDMAQRRYEQAMEAAKEAKNRASASQVLSPAEVIFRCKAQSASQFAGEPEERLRVFDCV